MEKEQLPAEEAVDRLTLQESKRVRKAAKQLRHEQATKQAARKGWVKKVVWIAIPVVVVGWFVWKVATSPQRAEGGLVSRQEVHWHAKLAIRIRGEDIAIPANIGIPVGQPNAHPENMHTHAEDRVVHIEKLPPVYEEDLKIGHFFRVWDKRFDSQCILDACMDQGGKLTMKVNGQDNTQFENYLLQDHDEVEIIFE